MRAGINRAEGTQATTIGANDLVLVQQISNGQPVPRLVKYSNFITGGGTGLTANSVPFINASGDFTQDNANFNYVASTHLLTINNISIGSSGNLGTATYYPATAANGTFVISATNNANNFAATLTNSAVAQNIIYTLPDPTAATANVVVTTLASGTEASNAVTASAFSGVITTSALTTAAGASYAITWTNTKVTTASKIFLTRAGGTNTRHSFVMDVVSGSGSATLTIYNTEPTNALNGTIIINYFIIP